MGCSIYLAESDTGVLWHIITVRQSAYLRLGCRLSAVFLTLLYLAMYWSSLCKTIPSQTSYINSPVGSGSSKGGILTRWINWTPSMRRRSNSLWMSELFTLFSKALVATCTRSIRSRHSRGSCLWKHYYPGAAGSVLKKTRWRLVICVEFHSALHLMLDFKVINVDQQLLSLQSPQRRLSRWSVGG